MPGKLASRVRGLSEAPSLEAYGTETYQVLNLCGMAQLVVP